MYDEEQNHLTRTTMNRLDRLRRFIVELVLSATTAQADQLLFLAAIALHQLNH